MVEILGLIAILDAINHKKYLVIAFYLYSNPAYITVYRIISLYKNYLKWPKTVVHNRFNKIISKLRIKIKYGLAIDQNLST